MICLHKFVNDLDLNYILDKKGNKLYEPETLIIGTFNPGWECIKNESAWFYGRKVNNFWDVLPLVVKGQKLIDESRENFIKFCKNYNIVITDIVRCICDADEDNKEHYCLLKNFQDKNINEFNKICFTDITFLLKNYENIKYVYFTRSTFTGINKIKNEWEKIKKVQFNRTIKFELLLTPSNYARFAGCYKKMKKENSIMKQYEIIAKCWKEKWHNLK